MTVYCPAKVNTFLSVGPPDEHGYHPIRTVFQAVSLFDELEIEQSMSDDITCDWPGLPAENTVTKALRLIRELVGIPPLSIRITKRIPSQAGLGGGSSDAAGVIRAAKQLAPDLVSDRFAHEVAVAVGADVPFFLVGGRARATGYGDVLEPQSDVRHKWLLVVKPESGVDTSEAYKKLDQAQREWERFSDAPYNDFERVAPFECGMIAERLRDHGATATLLCGSGSAVFGEFESEQGAKAAEKKILGEDIGKTFVVHTLTRQESLWIS